MGRVEKQEGGLGDLGGSGSPAPEAGRCKQTKAKDALSWQFEGQQGRTPQLTSQEVTCLSSWGTWLSLGTQTPSLKPTLPLLL